MYLLIRMINTDAERVRGALGRFEKAWGIRAEMSAAAGGTLPIRGADTPEAPRNPAPTKSEIRSLSQQHRHDALDSPGSPGERRGWVAE